MAAIQCPFTGCEYLVAEGTEPALANTLLSIHALNHPAPPPTAGPAAATRVEKVRRPDITTGGTTEDWVYFTLRWGDYVRATRIRGTEQAIQLMECCDEALRRDLTRNAGGTLVDQPIDTILAAIKTLAVRQENTMIARTTLHAMRQDRDEPARAFGARLRGQASVCKFQKQCHACRANVNYSEDNVADVLCRGLADIDIQQDLLGEQNQDLTVEQMLRFIEAKEAGKRSAITLHKPHQVEALKSTYAREKTFTNRDSPRDSDSHELDPQARCIYCGCKGHGKRSHHRI